MEDRALVYALGEIIATVDKMRGADLNTQRLLFISVFSPFIFLNNF